MSASKTFKSFAAASASAALILGITGTASAQNTIPGDDDEGRTVIVNSADATLELVNVDRDTGEVDYQMTNNLGATLTCQAVSENEDNRPGATISTADVIARGEHFYQHNQVTTVDDIDMGLGAGGGLVVAIWPILQLIPTGSAAGSLSERAMSQAEIVTGHDNALVGGMAGYDSSFTVEDDTTAERTVTLSPPAQAPRGDDELGIMVMCGEGGTQGDQQLYVWSAYESGEAPAVSPGGSGSLDLGSLGTDSAGSGSGS